MTTSPVPADSNVLFMTMDVMIRAYTKLDPSKTASLQLLWVEALGDCTVETEPFLQSLLRLDSDVSGFVRDCEEEGTRSHQLAMQAWSLDRITTAAEKSAFPFAAPLWGLVKDLNDGEIPPPPERGVPSAMLIDDGGISFLTDRLLKLCEVIRVLTQLCAVDELNGFPFLVPLVDLMREIARVVEGGG